MVTYLCACRQDIYGQYKRLKIVENIYSMNTLYKKQTTQNMFTIVDCVYICDIEVRGWTLKECLLFLQVMYSLAFMFLSTATLLN